MSTSTVKVQFIQHRQPPLDSGTYTVEVEQKVKTEGSNKIPEQTFSKELTFYVDGHRFAPLTPDSIYAVFPPAGNLGEYSNALPHIILKRGTLPWERTIKSTNSNLPWLALLLFQESEKPEPQTIKLKELKATSGNTKFPTFIYEPGQNDEDVLTVIDVPKHILEKILPTEKDIALLASVNQITNENDKPLSEPLATILGNRLPKKGEVSTVHLVALEERYDKDSGEFDYQGARPNDLIRLVSLASWSFTCVNSKHNFDALLKEIDRDPDTLRLPSFGNDAAKKYIDLGYVPLHHALRQGDKTISWYHSPLSTGQSSDNLTAPVAIADQLMRYDPNTGMFDVSYAMAWQLGRMLTLQNQPLAVEIFNWKRSKAQDLHQRQQQVLHLPFKGTTETNGDIPTAIANWFQDLQLLKNVPFNYLVPDARLLPPESLRFFWVDSYWVDCLQDGAFSVGRVTKEDLRLDVQSRSLPESKTQSDKTITGFLLNSEVVSGWPGLEIEGYVNPVTGTDFVGPENKLTILRRDLLSDNILLCFFDREVKTLDLALQGSSVNCGVDSIKKGTKITKGLRQLDGKQTTGNIEVPFRNQDLGVINIEEMTNRLKEGLKSTSQFTSAQFAATMIEGSPKVRFVARG
ncbi:MAG: hypothetical protein EWV49_14000 [Microcystis aeruginosa Ma_QC_Ch_20071001_S25]|jgi:hypothetical protein|uniref:Uncharacterized protein n=1 Tax=Microcystis aeruginosa Ma_QC_Ch_20071001_S25D TaxID=2486250 RepID=A0A552G352_MICAE|nr:hypothetical protein [Microcystis sp. M113S1]MCA2939786.1 hypothetical protein [Microcystis sp. M113S1]TRU48021.1 MAG: hypothetical protein EWV49_14000 [Microcystis aeruginosa Ma_QC_Ch_20071001_S25]TRU53391.1 MAG: hypothetical protein EWV57_03675 [Microcystis aeruginosa Ma_QC_Ch_20071001_S25D]TRU58579.1 MAG: hypothetical protein EWV90_18560 [Microcystis aeruginosa Ma_QC_Ch_20071001_M135]